MSALACAALPSNLPGRCFSAVLIVFSKERLGLGQRRAHRRQPFQRAQDLRLIIGQMAHQDVGVPDFREGPKLFRDFVDRSRDQGFCRHAAVASAQRLLQDRLCLGRRPPDVNAPERPSIDRADHRLAGVKLTVDFGDATAIGER